MRCDVDFGSPIETDDSWHGARSSLSDQHIDAIAFPVGDAALELLRERPARWLVMMLKEVCSRIIRSGGVSSCYAGKYRKAYVTLNLVLNEHFVIMGDGKEDRAARKGAIAPAFRPRLPLARMPKGRERDLSNDSQVIDLHFFHCLGQRRCMGDDNAIAALSGRQFDFDAAARFATVGGSTATKLQKLGLTEAPGIGFCRLGATVLRLPSDAKLRDRLVNNLAGVETQLSVRCRTNGADLAGWAELLQAGEALKKLDIELTGRNLRDMHMLMFGHSNTRSDSVLRKYRSAREWVGE